VAARRVKQGKAYSHRGRTSFEEAVLETKRERGERRKKKATCRSFNSLNVLLLFKTIVMAVVFFLRLLGGGGREEERGGKRRGKKVVNCFFLLAYMIALDFVPILRLFPTKEEKEGKKERGLVGLPLSVLPVHPVDLTRHHPRRRKRKKGKKNGWYPWISGGSLLP